MINKLKKIISKEQFDPKFIGIFINPFYFARKGLFKGISTLSKNVHGKTLDVGCGQKPYEKLFNTMEYVGLELDSPENRRKKMADYFYEGNIFPFKDHEFDSIILNQVLEHVFTPELFLNEVNRVLKNNGNVLITVPFVWDEHEQPHDFARYSSFGLSALVERHGFKVIEQRKSMNDIRAVFQLLNAYIYKKIFISNKLLNLLITLIFIAPFNILGELISKILPQNDDLYLDNIMLVQKVKNV